MRTNCFCVVVCLALIACGSDDPSPSSKPDTGIVDSGPTSSQPMAVLSPGESYAGKMLDQWAKEYMRWFYSQPTCDHSIYDKDGSQCGKYQDPDSPVFFFDRATYSPSNARVTSRTECTVPAGKAIVVPVSIFADDNVGATQPLTDDELREDATLINDSMRELVLRADGVDIEMEGRSIGVLDFEYWVPPVPNFYSCREQEGVADTVIKPSYLVGYLAVFSPPAPGPHELEYSGVLTFAETDLEYHVKTKFEVLGADE
jgi:hypothetical protein